MQVTQMTLNDLDDSAIAGYTVKFNVLQRVPNFVRIDKSIPELQFYTNLDDEFCAFAIPIDNISMPICVITE